MRLTHRFDVSMCKFPLNLQPRRLSASAGNCEEPASQYCMQAASFKCCALACTSSFLPLAHVALFQVCSPHETWFLLHRVRDFHDHAADVPVCTFAQ